MQPISSLNSIQSNNVGWPSTDRYWPAAGRHDSGGPCRSPAVGQAGGRPHPRAACARPLSVSTEDTVQRRRNQRKFLFIVGDDPADRVAAAKIRHKLRRQVKARDRRAQSLHQFGRQPCRSARRSNRSDWANRRMTTTKSSAAPGPSNASAAIRIAIDRAHRKVKLRRGPPVQPQFGFAGCTRDGRVV